MHEEAAASSESLHTNEQASEENAEIAAGEAGQKVETTIDESVNEHVTEVSPMAYSTSLPAYITEMPAEPSHGYPLVPASDVLEPLTLPAEHPPPPPPRHNDSSAESGVGVPAGDRVEVEGDIAAECDSDRYLTPDRLGEGMDEGKEVRDIVRGHAGVSLPSGLILWGNVCICMQYTARSCVSVVCIIAYIHTYIHAYLMHAVYCMHACPHSHTCTHTSTQTCLQRSGCRRHRWSISLPTPSPPPASPPRARYRNGSGCNKLIYD